MPRLSARVVGVSIVLVATLLYAWDRYWIFSRNYLPLEESVSLARGSTTHSFDVDLSGEYDLLVVAVDVRPQSTSIQCLVWDCDGQAPPLHATWEIKGERLVAAGDSALIGENTDFHGVARQIGRPYLSRGHYTLTLRVLQSYEVLNSAFPTLVVRANGPTYDRASHVYHLTALFSWLLFGVGCAIAFFPRPIPVTAEHVPDATPVPKGPRLYPPDRAERFSIRPRYITGIPHWHLVATIFYGCMMLLMMGMTKAFGPTMPRGFWVNLLPPKAEFLQSDGDIAPIIVRVSVTRRKLTKSEMAALPWWNRDSKYAITEHMLLNGEELPESQLRIKLRELLVTRVDRTVYVQGDEDGSFQTVANAIAAAKESYASRIVVLTTKDFPAVKKHR